MKKPSILIIFLTVFIDLIGFGIVLPLLPIYADKFQANGFEIGLIVASYSMMQFLFAPAWGRLSDRIGRRPVLLISNLGAAGSYALFAIASSYGGAQGLLLLLISRVFAGICGANLSVASAYIADISPPEKRSQRMGLIGMAFGLGFIFGPAIGALSASQFGLAGPGWVASIFCAGNFLLACVILKESRQPSSKPSPRQPKLAQWSHTLREPQARLLIGLFFLATFCFACFETTFPLLLVKNFEYDQRQVGYLFAYSGVIAAVIQGGLIGRLVKRYGEQRLIFWSLLIMAFSLVMLPFLKAPNVAGLLLGLGLFAIGSGINRPPTFGLLSMQTSADEQGAVMGVAQSAGSLARIIGPIFAASFYQIQAALPYILCAGIAVMAAMLAWQFLCKPAAAQRLATLAATGKSVPDVPAGK